MCAFEFQISVYILRMYIFLHCMISCYLCNTEYIQSTSNILIDDDASILSLAYVNIDLVPGHVYTKSIYKNNRHGRVIE